MQWRPFWTLLIGKSLLVSVAATATGAVDLPDPVFIERAGINGLSNHDAEGVLVNVPETISLDVNDSSASGVVVLTPSALGPLLDLQGSLTSISGRPAAGGFLKVEYAAAVARRFATAPDAPIRVFTQIQASLSAGAPVDGDRFGTARGSAAVYIFGAHGDVFGTPVNGGMRLEVGTLNGVPLDEIVWSLTYAENHVIEFIPDQPFAVTKEATFSLGGSSSVLDGGYEAQIIFDPIFTIDPTQLVEHEGVLTPASELYEIVYSPGIVPIVPEPISAMAIVVALSGRRRSRGG